MPEEWMVEAGVGRGFVGETEEVSGRAEWRREAEDIEASVDGSAELVW